MTESKKRTSRWRPGESGNPKGKPRGSGKLQRLREDIAKHLPEIIERLANAAREGDIQAAKVLVELVVPKVRPTESPAAIAIPEGASLTDKGYAVLNAAAAGEIGPSTAAQLISAIGSLAKIAELDELIKRVDQLERKLGEDHDRQKP